MQLLYSARVAGGAARVRARPGRASMMMIMVVALLLQASQGQALDGARILSKSKLWRDEDPTDGVCATKASGFDCVGKTCTSGPSDCYCSCGYHMYGGPQLAVTKAGTLLSIVEGRKHLVDGGDEGVGGHKAWHDILIKRSSDSGTTWSNASVLYSESAGWGHASGTANSTIGNGELVVDLETGEIFVFMCRNNSQVLLSSSKDDAVTFASKDVTEQVKPDSLSWGWYATSFSSVQLKFNKQHRGRLVGCADHVLHGFTAYPIDNSHSHTIISDDHGRSWRVGKTVQALNTSNECSLAELSNGTVVMNSRNYIGQSNDTVHRYISHSYDGGDSFVVGWFAQDLPDPIVFSDLTSTADGKTLLLTHPNSASTRRNVSLFASADGGASWSLSAQLESGPSEYSSVVVLPNGSVAVQVDAGCQGHKPSDYGNKACDKASPQEEDLFIVDLKSDDQDLPQATVPHVTPHCGDVFTLTKLDPSAPKAAPEAVHAKCLDGSLPAYSYRPGRGAGAKKLMIYLQGGGWCTSSAQCYNRSVGRGGQDRTLGSTVTLPPCSPIVDFYEGAEGLRSQNRSISAWADWAEAYFHYCDGGSLTGSRLSPDINHTANGQNCPNSSCAGPPIYYRGHFNFMSLLTQVIEQVQPTQVLIGGGSAGGMAVYHQCDRAAAMLATRNISLKCMPDAGLFPGGDWRTPGSDFLWMAENMESKLGLNERCVAHYDQNTSDPIGWRHCIQGAAALRFIRTPTYVLNSRYNWCGAYFLLPQCKVPLKPGQSKRPFCDIDFLRGSVASYRAVVQDAMAPAWDPSTPHGLFSDACQVHVESSVNWNHVEIDGVMMRDSAARWYFNHSVEKRLDPAVLHLNTSIVNGVETAVGFFSDNPTC